MEAVTIARQWAVALVLLATLSLPVAGQAVPAGGLSDALGKVEPQVLAELAANGQTSFFVWMIEQADLRPAHSLTTQAEKGQFVYEALHATADRSQTELRRVLDTMQADYQAFAIANKLLVRGGDLALLSQIAARSDVARITANPTVHVEAPVQAAAGGGTANVEPNLTFIGADTVWSMGYKGQGTVLAGNDTGLDETHAAIAMHYRGCLNPPTCNAWDHNYNWWDATGTYPSSPGDGHGHGTFVTGIMVGYDGGTNQIGVAPDAQTIHCKCLNNQGSGTVAEIEECLEWDLAPWDLTGANADPAKAPDAVNISWGGYGGGWTQFSNEIAALQAAGILVQAQAGSSGPGCGSLASPGDYAEVLTTGSVSPAAPHPGTLSSFSSRGPSSLDPNSSFPDVMAPGENIRSALPGNQYATWSGASMAGSHATALAGLIWSANPDYRGLVTETVELMTSTAVPLTGQGGSNCGGDYQLGPNNDWGYGTIDAEAAVKKALAGGWYWVQRMPCSIAFADSAVVWAKHDGGLWATGGCGALARRYDPPTDSWAVSTKVEPTPGYAWAGDGCYGLDENGDEVIVLFPDTTAGSPAPLHVYNITTDAWATPPVPGNFPQQGVFSADIVSMYNVNGQNVCYLSGGAATAGGGAGGGNLTDLWKYVPDTNTISHLGNYTHIPNGFNFHASWFVPWVGAKGAICVAGGKDLINAVYRDSQCYDLATRQFHPPNADLGLLPQALWGMADGWTTYEGQPQIWSAGGMDGLGTIVAATAYEDAASAGFGAGPPLLVPLYRMEGDDWYGLLYVMGGTTDEET